LAKLSGIQKRRDTGEEGRILKKIGVLSGKGGVGKTTVACSLALSLAKKGYGVGILDSDLTGANIHDVLGKTELDVINDRFVPASSKGVRYVSLGQIASDGDPVLWAGKDLESAAKQLLERTDWGELDYLVVDFPPGSGSEPQALLPMMDYALIVTVPSVLAESNVRRVIEMCRETQTPILGLVKNMTRFICPGCGREERIFPEDHSFEDLGIPTISEVPLNSKISREKLINDFPVDAVLEVMKNPVLLEKRERSMKRILLEFIFKRGG